MSLLKNLFGSGKPEPEEEKKTMVGKIYHIGDGWAFVSSPELPYTRIFLHWTGLSPDTLNFKDLKKGMRLEFEKKEMFGKTRAIKARVLSERAPDDEKDSGSV
jgi:hypothetical protein